MINAIRTLKVLNAHNVRTPTATRSKERKWAKRSNKRNSFTHFTSQIMKYLFIYSCIWYSIPLLITRLRHWNGWMDWRCVSRHISFQCTAKIATTIPFLGMKNCYLRMKIVIKTKLKINCNWNEMRFSCCCCCYRFSLKWPRQFVDEYDTFEL